MWNEYKKGTIIQLSLDFVLIIKWSFSGREINRTRKRKREREMRAKVIKSSFKFRENKKMLNANEQLSLPISKANQANFPFGIYNSEHFGQIVARILLYVHRS